MCTHVTSTISLMCSFLPSKRYFLWIRYIWGILDRESNLEYRWRISRLCHMPEHANANYAIWNFNPMQERLYALFFRRRKVLYAYSLIFHGSLKYLTMLKQSLMASSIKKYLVIDFAVLCLKNFFDELEEFLNFRNSSIAQFLVLIVLYLF